MPVEYNWVPGYEDPARMKREGRRGEFVSVTVLCSVFLCFYVFDTIFNSASGLLGLITLSVNKMFLKTILFIKYNFIDSLFIDFTLLIH